MPYRTSTQGVVLHHSLTKDGTVANWGAIRDYHMSIRLDGATITPAAYKKLPATEKARCVMPWKDIGYHYGIELIDGHYEILLGRPESEVAAAVKEQRFNDTRIHVCLVGNFDEAPPPPKQLDALVRLLKDILARYRFGTRNITTHHAVAPYKTCPGLQFPLDEVIRRVQE